MKYAHTCYRVFDLDKSVDFYTNGLGFDEQRRIPDPRGGDQRLRDAARLAFDQPLELTYNFGREEPYEIGTGYGHIALYVDDMDGTLATLAEKGHPAREAAVLDPRGRLAACASCVIPTGTASS